MTDNNEIVKAHRQGYKEGGAAGEILRGAMADKIKALTKEKDSLEAKLAKALEALRWSKLNQRDARAIIAEIEGE